MIAVDANLLLYAYDKKSKHHSRALRWWEQQLSSDDPSDCHG
ncbi:MAG: hypothetical protein AB1758_19310 [Candidatus Eremiobacterota bacterium]